MARKEIKGPINDQTLNNTNHNFKELYDEFGNVVDTVSTKAYEQVVDAAKLNWKDPVSSMDDLPGNAQEGDTRMVRNTGTVYRYNGAAWAEIQQIDAGPVNEVDSRLTSQLAQIPALENWEIQNKRREEKPLLTIVDDDGHMAVMEQLVPLANKYDFKFTCAVIKKWMTDDDPRHMSIENVRTLYEMGHEIASHTYGHIRLNETDENELKSDFEQMDHFMKNELGIGYKTLVYPFGARNDLSINIGRKYVRAARSTDYGINYAPIQTWDLKSINGWTRELDSLVTSQEKINYYKRELDKACENNGWAIYTSHIYMPADDHAYIIEEIVKYAKSLGIEIVTLNEGLNRFGNIIDTGRYWDADLTKNHHVLGVNGEVKSSFNNVIVHKKTGVSHDTPPTQFGLGNIYKTRILYRDRIGFPEDNYGLLTTNTEGAVIYDEYITQNYEPAGTGRIYTRHAINAMRWSNWEMITPTKRITGDITANTSVSNFPDRSISLFRVSFSNRNGFPPSSGGLLTTQRLFGDEFAYQEFEPLEDNIKYKRFWKDGSWSSWEVITGTRIIYGSITVNTPITAFPQRSIAVNVVSFSDREGFPPSSGGVLTTVRIAGDDAFAYQEFDPLGKSIKYKRYWDVKTNSWSDFNPLNREDE